MSGPIRPLRLPAIDRRLLPETSLALDDNTYTQVIAGMGVSRLRWTSTARGPQQALLWSLDNFELGRERLGELPSVQALLEYRDAWVNVLAESPDRRLVLDEQGFRGRTLDLIEVVRILDQSTIGARSLFVRKQASHADLQWRWPLRISAFPKDLDALELARLSTVWPSESLAQVQPLTREQARCEILVLVGTVRRSLRDILAVSHSIRAGYLLVLCPLDAAWATLRSHVDSLFAETQAGGLSLVSQTPGAPPLWESVNTLVTELSHNLPFDVALGSAFPKGSSLHLLDVQLLDAASLTNIARNLGSRLKRLPPNMADSLSTESAQNRLGLSRSMPTAELAGELETRGEALPYGAESAAGTGLREIALAEREARLEAARTETPRYLQGDLASLSEGGPVTETRGFIVGTRYRLDVFIAPLGEGAISADVGVDESRFDWQERDSYTLQVLFVEPRQWEKPLAGTLELPREGRSKTCQFVFTPTQPGPFAGRIILYYRGRVLQTALLEAIVLPAGTSWSTVEAPAPLRFAVEAEVRRGLTTLDERRRFDACLVLNHTSAGTPAATAAGKEGAYVASLDGIDSQLVNINRLLNQVALDAKRYGKDLLSAANARLLCDLAAEGNVLYRNLVLDYIDRSSAAQALRDAEYLQVVSARPDAIVPLEFVYDFPPPAVDAPVCKNAKQALRDGRCPNSCKPDRSPAPVVCPLGFWGLRKVIERHVYDPDLPKPAKIEAGQFDPGEPLPGRDTLGRTGPSLLATSKQVPRSGCTRLKKRMQSSWGGLVTTVDKWSSWPDAVKATEPVLLMVLPHTDGTGSKVSLEIQGDVLESRYIDQSYVCGGATSHPIVLLLGCDVANVATVDAYFRHVAVFRQAKAALVLGTVATVFAPDVAKVAAQLIERLGRHAASSQERFGEMLRAVKRAAVADSLMMAMCLVAFGDADWYLK
jgi:hypothetical protein